MLSFTKGQESRPYTGRLLVANWKRRQRGDVVNFYLLFLCLYAVLILPMTLTVELRVGERWAYRVQVNVTGLRLGGRRFRWGKAGRGKERKPEAAEAYEPVPSLLKLKPALWRLLLSRPFWRSLRRSVHVRRLWVRLHVAFPDAAATAVGYVVAATAMDVFRHIGFPLAEVELTAQADFSGKGTQAVIGGILFARLGSLALVTSRAIVRYQRIRGEESIGLPLSMEEDEHATAPH